MSPKISTVFKVVRVGRKVVPTVASFVGNKLVDALNDPERLEAWFKAGAERLKPRPAEVLSIEEIEDSLDALDVVLAEHGEALPEDAPAQMWSAQVRRLRAALTVARSAPEGERERQAHKVQKQAENLYQKLSKALLSPQRSRFAVPRLGRRAQPQLEKAEEVREEEKAPDAEEARETPEAQENEEPHGTEEAPDAEEAREG